MILNKNVILALGAWALIVLLLLGTAVVALVQMNGISVGSTRFVNQTCRNASSSPMLVQTSSTNILASSSNRIWARISVFPNATNTIYFALHDFSAVVGRAFSISSSTPVFDIDLTRPYTGPLQAIADSGIVEVLVQECNAR